MYLQSRAAYTINMRRIPHRIHCRYLTVTETWGCQSSPSSSGQYKAAERLDPQSCLCISHGRDIYLAWWRFAQTGRSGGVGRDGMEPRSTTNHPGCRLIQESATTRQFRGQSLRLSVIITL